MQTAAQHDSLGKTQLHTELMSHTRNDVAVHLFIPGVRKKIPSFENS